MVHSKDMVNSKMRMENTKATFIMELKMVRE